MCCVCMHGCVTCVYIHVGTVRSGGFTKLLKFLLRPREGQGLAHSHTAQGATMARVLVPVSLWFPFSSHSSLFLRLHNFDALSV